MNKFSHIVAGEWCVADQEDCERRQKCIRRKLQRILDYVDSALK